MQYVLHIHMEKLFTVFDMNTGRIFTNVILFLQLGSMVYGKIHFSLSSEFDSLHFTYVCRYVHYKLQRQYKSARPSPALEIVIFLLSHARFTDAEP
jgi:hypothetical protein